MEKLDDQRRITNTRDQGVSQNGKIRTDNGAGVADARRERYERRRESGVFSGAAGDAKKQDVDESRSTSRRANAIQQPRGRQLSGDQPSGCDTDIRLANSGSLGREWDQNLIQSTRPHSPERYKEIPDTERSRTNFWSGFDLIPCLDNKARRVESGTFPLVDGPSKGMGRSGDPSDPINSQATTEARMMRLKGYGNAIVPQVAATFIKAYMDVTR